MSMSPPKLDLRTSCLVFHPHDCSKKRQRKTNKIVWKHAKRPKNKLKDIRSKNLKSYKDSTGKEENPTEQLMLKDTGYLGLQLQPKTAAAEQQYGLLSSR